MWIASLDPTHGSVRPRFRVVGDPPYRRRSLPLHVRRKRSEGTEFALVYRLLTVKGSEGLGPSGSGRGEVEVPDGWGSVGTGEWAFRRPSSTPRRRRGVTVSDFALLLVPEPERRARCRVPDVCPTVLGCSVCGDQFSLVGEGEGRVRRGNTWGSVWRLHTVTHCVHSRR